MKPYRQVVARFPEAEPDDFYATSPEAALALLEIEPQLEHIWEPACGMGHLSKVFEMKGKLTFASDLRDRGCVGAQVMDFFDCTWPYYGDIVTNPPYSISTKFVLHALKTIQPGRFVCMFLPLTFLESQRRYEKLFKTQPPKRLHVFSKRVQTVKNGDFNKYGNSMKAFAWYVWEKGFTGDPTIKWI